MGSVRCPTHVSTPPRCALGLWGFRSRFDGLATRSRVQPMPASVTPNHGNTGTKSFENGGAAANPIQARNRVLKVGVSRKSGAASVANEAKKTKPIGHLEELAPQAREIGFGHVPRPKRH